MSIKTKILVPAIVLTLIVAAAILAFNVLSFSDFVDDSTVSRVNSAHRVAHDSLDALKNEARANSLSFAKDPTLISALERDNRQSLRDRANALKRGTDIEFCTITDANGKVIFRTHEPKEFGDSVASQANVQSAMKGKALTVIEEGSIVRLSVRAGTPVVNQQGQVIGVVSVGYRLDTNDFVDSIKEMMGCETTIVLGTDRIATTVIQEDGARAIGTKADAEIAETVLGGESYSGRVDILGRTAVCKYTPIEGADGKPIGMLFIGQYLDVELKLINNFVQGGLLITLIVLAIFIIIILVIVGRIVTPIRDMTKAASALAVGDTDLDVKANTQGEMRILSDAFNSMIENTRQQVQMVEHIANGDLGISIQARSEKDVMNRALERLNQTIRAQAAEIQEEHERTKLMMDATPLASRLWNRHCQIIECNEAAVKLFGLKNKQEYLERYFEFSPEYQPDGQKTREKIKERITETFEKGKCTYSMIYQLLDGTPIPVEITMVRVPYGDDYIVASYSRDLREQEKMIKEIKQRDELLQTVNQTADILLRSETDDFANVLQQCMGMMARGIDADRMYLFKNRSEGDKLLCTQLYEWAVEGRALQGAETVRDLLYDETTPEIREILSRGECVHTLVRDMESIDRAWLEKQGILSILIVPVQIQNQFWGFVGFDNCHSERLFAENEESIMRSSSMLIANALQRNENMLSIRDASARLQVALQDAKNANEAKSNFLAQMSHEIRTPLNAVVGLSELMLNDDDFKGEAEEKLENIHTSGMTILSIVNDILDISKIESGKFEINPVKYDTPSLINDVVSLNIVRIEEKAIDFKLLLDEDFPGTLYGDDLRVKQVFNNLLSNAFKYTNYGTVEWKVSAEWDGDSVWIVSSVRDTGIGIRAEDLEKLFADYNQVDAKMNRKVTGTGLGLAITKRLTEMMEGTITVESEYGKGTTFSIRLRQSSVSDVPIGKEVAENLMSMRYTFAKRDRNMKLSHIDLSYAHVLVVDDIATNLDVVKGMMKPYGLQIDCAINGQQAVDMVASENPRYRAVFMDHMMPGMDGIEATKIIREIGTEYAKNLPIIALTANAILGNEEMFLDRGFQAFMSKPIDLLKLDSVLRLWVRDKAMEEELPDAAVKSESDTDSQETETPVSSLTEVVIHGVDLEKLLKRFNHDKVVLADVLKSYAVNTRPLLEQLQKDLSAEDLEDYAIVVHGIKGSSYGIFAQEVGKAAEALELAAKAGDFALVKTEHASFKKCAEALIDQIDTVLGRIEADADKPNLAEPDPALLEELRDACRVFNMDRVDAVMAQLESFRYEKGADLVLWLREKVNDMDFETIFGGEWPFS